MPLRSLPCRDTGSSLRCRSDPEIIGSCYPPESPPSLPDRSSGDLLRPITDPMTLSLGEAERRLHCLVRVRSSRHRPGIDRDPEQIQWWISDFPVMWCKLRRSVPYLLRWSGNLTCAVLFKRNPKKRLHKKNKEIIRIILDRSSGSVTMVFKIDLASLILSELAEGIVTCVIKILLLIPSSSFVLDPSLCKCLPDFQLPKCMAGLLIPSFLEKDLKPILDLTCPARGGTSEIQKSLSKKNAKPINTLIGSINKKTNPISPIGDESWRLLTCLLMICGWKSACSLFWIMERVLSRPRSQAVFLMLK